MKTNSQPSLGAMWRSTQTASHRQHLTVGVMIGGWTCSIAAMPTTEPLRSRNICGVGGTFSIRPLRGQLLVKCRERFANSIFRLPLESTVPANVCWPNGDANVMECSSISKSRPGNMNPRRGSGGLCLMFSHWRFTAMWSGTPHWATLTLMAEFTLLWY